MILNELFESLRTENPCWKGYHPVGTKQKNGRTVPNCVPKEGVDEGAGDIGARIRALCQKIYNQGDDEFEYFYNDSPIFAQYWDEYEGDLDSIIAEADPQDLQVILNELESYVQTADLEEGNMSPMAKDAQQADRIRSLENLIAIAREQGRQLRVQELEIELKKLQGVEETISSFNVPSTSNSGSGEFRGVNIPSELKHPEWKEPTWSFQEIAQKLGISVPALNLLAFKRIGGFPEAIPGIASRYGSKKYYKQSEVKRWVNANSVREKLKQGVAEMDSQGYTGTRDQGDPYAKGSKATPVKAKDVVKQGVKALNKAINKSHPDYGKHEKKLISKMSNAEKVDKGWRNPNVDEGEKVGHMDADKFDDAMARLKKLAGAGPMKTVWDPNTRRYKNVPVAVQPKQQPSK